MAMTEMEKFVQDMVLTRLRLEKFASRILKTKTPELVELVKHGLELDRHGSQLLEFSITDENTKLIVLVAWQELDWVLTEKFSGMLH